MGESHFRGGRRFKNFWANTDFLGRVKMVPKWTAFCSERDLIRRRGHHTKIQKAEMQDDFPGQGGSFFYQTRFFADILIVFFLIVAHFPVFSHVLMSIK